MARSVRGAAEADAEKEEKERNGYNGVDGGVTTSAFRLVAGATEMAPGARIARVQTAIMEVVRKQRTGAEEQAVRQAAEKVVVAVMQVERMEEARSEIAAAVRALGWAGAESAIMGVALEELQEADHWMAYDIIQDDVWMKILGAVHAILVCSAEAAALAAQPGLQS